MQRTLFTESSIDEAAEAFHLKNPQVMGAILAMARKRMAEGATQWSMQAAFSALRFAQDMKTTGTDIPNVGRVRLANSMTAWFARKIVHDYPEFEGFFILRPRPSQ